MHYGTCLLIKILRGELRKLQKMSNPGENKRSLWVLFQTFCLRGEKNFTRVKKDLTELILMFHGIDFFL